MADRLDVDERLAEGRPAVEHTETYVRACHVLGYQHPDLTEHPAQIRDWYDSEDGLDLRALDRDCAELRAAGAAVMEAVRMQRAQLAELAAAWTGPGGDSAVGFLERHCDAANAVATEVRAAAQRCESLRDNLWYLVDSKVATAIAIDDRTRAKQPAWLAAAAAVTTGVGDRPSAEEVVRQQITPYVDNEIRDDWLTTMRSTAEGIDAAYGMVIDRMAAAPSACFEVPGDLGPGYQPLPTGATRPAAPVSPVAVPGPPAEPAPAPAPAAAPPPPRAPPPKPPAPATAPPTPAAPPAIPAAPLPDLGTAGAIPAGDLGGGTGGLGGLAGRIVDAMGSLLGSAADPTGTEDAFDDEDPFHADDVDDADDGPDEPEGAKDVEMARPVAAPPPVDGPPASVDVPPAPLAAPEPVAAPPSPGPAPPANEKSTPCEIAADQLPQAGQ